jgi:hypothetical protein
MRTGGRGTGRMPLIQVFASPHDLDEVFKRIASFQPPGLERLTGSCALFARMTRRLSLV